VQQAGHARALAALAYAYECRGLVDAAPAEYERAYALDPVARFDSKASAAYLYSVKGRLADALKANVEVSGRRSELRFLDIQIASNLELLGFVSAAEQRYERSFLLYPDSVYSNVAWPRSPYLQGRLDEAEAAIGLALLRPAHPELHVLDGELALLRGDRDRARAAFAKAHAMPKSIVKSLLLFASPCVPGSPGPKSASVVGSVVNARLIVALKIPFVAGVALSTPLSSLSPPTPLKLFTVLLA
jgi:tetratricopeptide (TPR) repeat protein